MDTAGAIQVVDLFAGPGGLGEGFSSHMDGCRFNIVVSAEMDEAAHKTLRLRSFYRHLKKNNSIYISDYYDYCNGVTTQPWSEHSKKEWDSAGEEAKRLTLGTPQGDKALDIILDDRLDRTRPWVLIGGPPCQAYSLVGRARNKGKLDYTPEEDSRHFLYLEYLRIIKERSPAIFVMENVKGILSSKINGQNIFPKILEDLSDPNKALGDTSEGRKYKICSFVTDECYEGGVGKPSDFKSYIIRAERFGIPQARHRVILLGIAVDEYAKLKKLRKLTPVEGKSTVADVIGSLPPIRSRLTKSPDSDGSWLAVVKGHAIGLLNDIDRTKDYLHALELRVAYKTLLARNLKVGALKVPRKDGEGATNCKWLDSWYLDERLRYWLNHDARGHMSSDLKRYFYASTYAKAFKSSPKGHGQFNLPGLAPAHKNWESGKFSDRFRVQCESLPSTTITSHISKDGHYFIHPDPSQCRSFSVREAARLQTFPDNYLFEGNRSQQFHQVGNAVPPLLASQIACIVADLMCYIVGDS